jgi:hypothetical protein
MPALPRLALPHFAAERSLHIRAKLWFRLSAVSPAARRFDPIVSDARHQNVAHFPSIRVGRNFDACRHDMIVTMSRRSAAARPPNDDRKTVFQRRILRRHLANNRAETNHHNRHLNVLRRLGRTPRRYQRIGSDLAQATASAIRRGLMTVGYETPQQLLIPEEEKPL